MEQNRRLNRDATTGAQQMAASFKVVESGLSNIHKQLLGLVSLGAISAFAKNVLDLNGQLADLSDRTGISAQTLSGIRTQLQQGGVDLETFARSISIAQKNLGNMDEEGSAAAKALKVLNLNVLELVNTTPDEFLKRFAEALSKVENVNQRTALAMAVLGRAGAELAPVVAGLARDFDKLKASGLSEETIRNLDEMGDAWIKFKNTVMDTAGTLFVFLAEKFNATILRLKELKLSFLEFSGRNEPEIRRLQQEIAEARERRDQAEITRRDIGIKATFDPGAEDRARKATTLLEKQQQAAAQLQGQLLQLNLALAESKRAEGDLTVDVEAAALALIENKAVAAELAAIHNNTLTPAVKNLIEMIRQEEIAQLKAKEAEFKRKQGLAEIARLIADANAVIAENEENLHLELRAQEESLRVKKESADLDFEIANAQADRLSMIGKTQQAEQLRYQSQIKNLERLRELEGDPKRKSLITEQIQNVQMQLDKLGNVTIDIGKHVGDTLENIFSSMISGTLKSVDVGKAALATIGNIASDIFRQAIKNKLSFELNLFNNLKTLPGQMNQAFQSGVPAGGGGTPVGGVGGGAGGGGGGFNLFGGGGISGFLGGFGTPATTTIGSGGIFNLPGIGQGGTTGGFLPSGTSLGGILGGALGGFGLGRLINPTMGGGIAGALGGAAGSLIGGSTAIGGMLGLAGGSIAGSLTSMLTPMLGAMMAGLMTSFIIPGIGAIIAALVSLLFKQKPNPSVWVKSVITFFYDTLAQGFGAVATTMITKIKDIKASKAIATAEKHQAIIQAEADRFADLLNSFPIMVHDAMAATIDAANEHLNKYLGGRKYSEGGKRSIQQELESLKLTEAPTTFWHALRETIGVGFQETLQFAGLMVSNLTQAFPELIGGSKDLRALELPVGTPEATQKFIDAIKKLAGFTGTLATFGTRTNEALTSAEAARQYLEQNPDVAADWLGTPFQHFVQFGRMEGRQWPRSQGAGIGRFLTADDLSRIEDELNRVFSLPSEKFAEGVDDMLERLQPISEFLTKAVQQASELFGKGMVAALEAASESEGVTAFLNTINSGIKDVIFSGIIEAFTASAQFTDLLAPIQKTIREFTQEAFASGIAPDIGAFRQAIFPAIEEITTRVDLLRPLIEVLQQLGFDIRSTLGLLPPPTEQPTAPAAPVNVTININGNVNDEADAAALAQTLGRHINSLLAPPQ